MLQGKGPFWLTPEGNEAFVSGWKMSSLFCPKDPALAWGRNGDWGASPVVTSARGGDHPAQGNQDKRSLRLLGTLFFGSQAWKGKRFFGPVLFYPTRRTVRIEGWVGRVGLDQSR